jgi:hypothetical protein
MSLDKPLAFQKLDIYVVARELVRVVSVAKIRDAEFRDQAERAAKSTFVDGASVIGAIDIRIVTEVMALANRLEAMLIAMKR